MIKAILGFLSSFIIGLITALNYWGIILAMAIESACIPLPSEIIMPFGGYLVVTKVFNSGGGDLLTLFYVGLAGAFGCVLGSVAAYAVGIWGGRPILEKYGKYILISKKDIDMADKWFTKYGDFAIFFSRLLPVIRTFISLPAGIAKMNFPKFVIYSFLGSLPWCFALAWVGYKIGQSAGALIDWEHQMSAKLGNLMHVIDVVIILGVIALVVWYVRRHLKNDAAEKVSK